MNLANVYSILIFMLKSKCVINIVERNKKVKTFNMDPKCKAKRPK